MLNEVERSIQRHALLEPRASVHVAVSGGVDSMVLLHVLVRLGYRCSVAHVDHGLRGVESDADQELVRSYCEAERIPFQGRRVEVQAHAVGKGISVQMAARELRFTWFQELVEQGPHRLALAHHADDAVETLVMNLMRGPGASGWGGIRPRNGAFIRPLIDRRKAEILDYARRNGVPYREDRSNTDPKYLRNRIRGEVLPLLNEVRAGSSDNLIRAVELFRELQEAASRRVDDLLGTPVPDANGEVLVPFEVFERSGTPQLVLHRLLRGREVHPAQQTRILEAMRLRRTGAVFPFSDGRLFVDRRGLLMAPPAVSLPTWTIPTADRVPPGAPLAIRSAPFEGAVADVPDHIAWFDPQRLHFPLVLRPWQLGDRMRPAGMEGTRLISDMLIDLKRSRVDKERQWVLESRGEVIWLVGHRVAQGAAAVQGCPEAWRIEVVA
ncbi:MAG TPA: tRNA lysidine(34) synthetase TilS [Flavobacteriales bacterium]